MITAQYLTFQDRLVYVEQAGEGPTVLCIHTAGQSGVQWRHTIQELADLGYRVIVPDLPGHGRSEPAAAGLVDDLSVYGTFCLELLDRLGVERPYIVGCSNGGKIALDIATKASPRLAGVVAMAADSHNVGASAASLRRSLEDSTSPSRADRTYAGTLAGSGRSLTPEKTEMIALMHRREDPYVTTSDLIGWATIDLRPGLPSIVCPTHLVVGRDDFYLDIPNAERTAAMIPGATFQILEGIGHYPMEEVDGFAGMLDSWLRAMI